ncbi:putative chlorophyll(ide) b reductase NYC1 [Hibiscus syriacus]|uniref:Chlorophyll(Ide) b reductase NYC1 n=1 Tax=Hibiscus syriacus TaxID=106335 RepID=A0A6A2XZC6_HIBSY|nr:putative chlorophyll(ide) b reductase NYC1 [Hibiscus syriacus]
MQIGRYIVTMMSTGLILLTGFQLSGGESQMNTLIWYSWVGGIIIGTMIGANMGLDETLSSWSEKCCYNWKKRIGKALAREFLLSGDGSGGSTAVYGSTKCVLRKLHASLFKECKRSKLEIHTASPGMVRTDLFLSDSTLKNKQMFNIICELPETVARSLVPRMRVVKGTGKAINYLTPPRILLALITAWLRQGRWFDEQGRALYAVEADRIRNWAENRTRFSFTDAMEMYTENTWVSVFSLSVCLCLHHPF